LTPCCFSPLSARNKERKEIVSIDKEKEEKLGSILLSEVKEEAVAEEFDPWKYWTFSFDSQFK
jgi:hypothetical protein